MADSQCSLIPLLLLLYHPASVMHVQSLLTSTLVFP